MVPKVRRRSGIAICRWIWDRIPNILQQKKITEAFIIVEKVGGKPTFLMIPPLYPLFGNEMAVNRLLLSTVPVVVSINIFLGMNLYFICIVAAMFMPFNEVPFYRW